jgi:hypothetical protein
MGLVDRLGWVVLAVSVGGCGRTAQVAGEGPSPEPTEALSFAKSGTRLKARGYAADDAELFRSLYDSKLRFDCEMVEAADGDGVVCVPKPVVAKIFLDASCREPATWQWPVGGLDNAAELDGNAVSVGEAWAGCETDPLPHREAFVVGEQVYSEDLNPGSWPDVYALQNGECVKSGPPAKEFPAVRRLTQLAEGELASARAETVPVGSDLQARRFVSRDGAELTVGVAGKDGVPCALQPDGLCVPGPVATRETPIRDNTTSGVYAALDASCQRPAFFQVSSCGEAEFGVEQNAGETQTFRLEKPTAIFQRLPDSVPTEELRWVCQPLAEGVPRGFFAPGALVPRTQFPAAHEVQRGEGALHIGWFAAGATEESLLQLVQGPNAVFSDSHGQACDVVPASDGTLRCVPSGIADEPFDPASLPQVFEVDL